MTIAMDHMEELWGAAFEIPSHLHHMVAMEGHHRKADETGEVVTGEVLVVIVAEDVADREAEVQTEDMLQDRDTNH